jgi:hypothetical protein
MFIHAATRLRRAWFKHPNAVIRVFGFFTASPKHGYNGPAKSLREGEAYVQTFRPPDLINRPYFRTIRSDGVVIFDRFSKRVEPSQAAFSEAPPPESRSVNSHGRTEQHRSLPHA